ncbi:GNAT family N-acetyltransferase [Bacillus sp. E(2018)]|uniref:GNAT family N-acetyltransferase n=1 Tax=Bacillus sp. E(2018) TaxID=2502239 RepID=UPI0010F68B79|nr:GNAT family N-acetyltransferase [Bacillus sp. E(2018)]
MEIRKAIEEDFAELATLMGELGYPTTDEQMKQRFKEIHNDINYHTLVVEEDGILLGMIGMFKGLAYEKDERYVRIISLVVRKEFRNQKIGKLLVEHAELWAKEQGVLKLAVNTGKRRVDSHHFYKARGFDDTGAGFYKTIC